MISGKTNFSAFSTNAKFLGESNIVFCDKDSNILILRQNEFAENDLERIKLLVIFISSKFKVFKVLKILKNPKILTKCPQ